MNASLLFAAHVRCRDKHSIYRRIELSTDLPWRVDSTTLAPASREGVLDQMFEGRPT